MNKYIHYGHDKFDINLFKPIKKRLMFSKPDGGFWASSKDYEFPWSAWCENENYTYENDFLFFEFSLLPNSKILTIDQYEKLEKLPEDKETIKIQKKIHIYENPLNPKYIDFEKLSLEYDAIEVLISKDFDKLHFSLYGWDCDSILIMNPNIISKDEDK